MVLLQTLLLIRLYCYTHIIIKIQSIFFLLCILYNFLIILLDELSLILVDWSRKIICVSCSFYNKLFRLLKLFHLCRFDFAFVNFFLRFGATKVNKFDVWRISLRRGLGEFLLIVMLF